MKETYWQKLDHIIGPTTIKDFPQVGQQETRDKIEEYILSVSDENTKLLDAGCNTGVEGYRLFQKGFEGSYHGIDSNKLALDYAVKNLNGCNASFHCFDLSSIDFPDRQFDIVLNKDVIEHAEYYTDIITELCRLTGKLFILSMFIKMHDKDDFIKLESAGYYHNRYNRRKLYEFVGSCGFKAASVLYEKNEDEILIFERL